MYAAIKARHARFISSVLEPLPKQRNRLHRGHSRLDLRTACRQCDRIPETITSRPKLQNLSGCGAVGAVAGNIFWERRCRKGHLLIRNPLCAVHLDRALSWAAPRADSLAAEKKRDRRDRTNRIVRSFRIPCRDTRVEHCVAQSEEHSHVIIESVMIPLRYPLRQHQPVARRLL